MAELSFKKATDHIYTQRQKMQNTEKHNEPDYLAYADYEKVFSIIETWTVLERPSTRTEHKIKPIMSRRGKN